MKTKDVEQGCLRARADLAMAESYGTAVTSLVPIAVTTCAPFNMMLAHALELSLKAVLAHAGEEERLMTRGHDLGGCYERACAIGLTGAAADQVAAIVECLGGPHRDQRFRYPGFPVRALDVSPTDAAATLSSHLRDVGHLLAREVSRGATVE